MKEKIIIALKGFCMGAADVVPGVSGGTMALILGIYARWLNAIRSFDALWLRHIFTLEWRGIVTRPDFGFVIPLILGIFAAILFFTRVVPLPELLHSHPELVYGLFFGLIAGSIPPLLREAGRFDVPAAIYLLLGIGLGWFIVNLVPVDTPSVAWFIFLSGALAICALLLPGISGSFILLILRQYDTVFAALGRFDFSIIIPFALGALTGLVGFSRLLSWLLARWYREALLLITGILIGALWIIWPFQQREYLELHGKRKLIASHPQWPDSLDLTVAASVGMMLLGLAAVLWLHYLSARQNPPTRES